MRSLCDWHAGLELRNWHGWTALHYASYYGHVDCVRELIAQGADVSTASHSGTTPLMSASSRCRIDNVCLLLAAGADKRQLNSHGQTAHDVAGLSIMGDAAAIRALLDAAP